MADLHNLRVGVIGAGAIGGALIDRLVNSKSVAAANIVACEPKEPRRQEISSRYGVKITSDPGEAASCNIVVLAAPPLEIRRILDLIRGRMAHRPLVISFAAAVSVALLESWLASGIPLVRVNPNSPTIVGAGYNPVVYGSNATGSARDLANQFLALLGASPAVSDSEMNLYTALTAVGPTYFIPVFDAMISAGITGGLPRQTAVAAAVETARGCAQMVSARAEGPEQLKLLTGLRPLEDANVRALVSKAISEALSRMDAVQKQAAS